MNSQLTLRYILGLLACLSSTVVANSNELPPPEPLTSQEIQEYAASTAERVHHVAQSILAISSEEETYENTLSPWNRLTVQVLQDLDTLQSLAESDAPCNETAAQSLEDLDGFLSQTLNSAYLHQKLAQYAQKLIQDDTSDLFQKYIAMRLINNRRWDPVYLHSSAENEVSWDADFLLFNFDPTLIEEVSHADLAQSVASANADVVYLSDVDCDEDAYDAYQALEKDYAHFVYLPSHSRTRLNNGLLIASKRSLGDIELNTLKVLPIKSHKDKDRDDNKPGGSFRGGVKGEWGMEKG